MSNIIIKQLEPDLTRRLERRAARNGHSIEAEIKSILYSVLERESESNIDLATAIDRRFASLEDFEIPELTRDSMRTPPPKKERLFLSEI